MLIVYRKCECVCVLKSTNDFQCFFLFILFLFHFHFYHLATCVQKSTTFMHFESLFGLFSYLQILEIEKFYFTCKFNKKRKIPFRKLKTYYYYKERDEK